MADEALNRPSARIAVRADCVALDFFSHLKKHVDLFDTRLAFRHALHHAIQPAGTLAARRALAATFMRIKSRKPRDREHHIGRFIHDDEARGAEARSGRAQARDQSSQP